MDIFFRPFFISCPAHSMNLSWNFSRNLRDEGDCKGEWQSCQKKGKKGEKERKRKKEEDEGWESREREIRGLGTVHGGHAELQS